MEPPTRTLDLSKYEAAYRDAQASGDRRKFAQACNDLGVTYVLEGRLDEAGRVLAEAQGAFAELNDPAGRAFATGNLARLSEKLGRSQAAVDLYREAADLFHQAGDYETESLTLRSLSQAHFKMGKIFPALASYTRALEVKPRRGMFDNLLLWLFRIPLGMMGGNPPA